MDLNGVLQRAVESGASDVHFKAGQPPVLRFDGELIASDDFPALGEVELGEILGRVTAVAPRRRELFEATGDLDIAYTEPGLPRFRVNGFRQPGCVLLPAPLSDSFAG